MFCPSCGTQSESGLKFCKQCGLALNRIRGVMSRGGANPSWNDVWIQDELEKRDNKRKKSPEQKRLEEIKAGVITTSVGVGATIFLYFLMNAIAANEPREAEILRSVWLAGLVPLMVGLSILFNALVISPKIVALKRRETMSETDQTPSWTPAADTNSFAKTPVSALPEASFEHSVTEHTTAKLKEKIPVPASRDTH
jgi:hypothetical protein